MSEKGLPRSLILGRRAFVASVLAAPALFSACAGPSPAELSRRKYGNDPANYVDGVIVWKAERTLALVKNQVYVRAYRMNLGFAPLGHKTESGDGKTPEGFYEIDRRNPRSDYHLSVGISYPNDADRQQARERGVSPGGDIFIHGGPTRRADRNRPDWTAGCIAVTNDQIEEIWAYVPVGTPVAIYAGNAAAAEAVQAPADQPIT
jgi:murein L,D-transpeptidase YafK